jgi:[ribosomal protein S18]-alanine N-acetyltransferase
MEQPKSKPQPPNNSEGATPVTIRPAAAADLVSVLAIEHDSPSAAQWKNSDYAKALNEPTRLFLVAEEEADNRVIGFLVASTATEEWELENIAVSPAARRRGIGRALMNALIQQAQHRGALEIRQEVRVSNSAAQNLGRSAGFLPEGRRKGYYRNPREDALLFKYLTRTRQVRT